MKIKKYIAPTLREAMQQIKEELGPDAIIVNTREFKEGGVFGALKDSMVEVTAAIEEDKIPEKKPEPLREAINKVFTEEKISQISAPNYLSKEFQKNSPNQNPLINIKTEDYLNKADKKYQETKNSKIDKKDIITDDSKVIIDKKDFEELKLEMRTVKDLLNELNLKYQEQEMANIDANLKQIYNSLIKNDLENKIVMKLIEEIKEKIAGKNDIQYIAKVSREVIMSHIKTANEIEYFNQNTLPYKIVLIGPTGVGKTTTLAKLAAIYAIKKHLKVGLLTIDTYRIAAVEQLKTFAKIIGLPIEVAYKVEDIKNILKNFKNFDIILVDTVGRSQKDKEELANLLEFVKALEPNEIHLLLNLTTKYSDMKDIIKSFSIFPINRLLFTKLDETNSIGNLYNVAYYTGAKISYITTGQNVPDDIEACTSDLIAKMVLEGL